MKLTGRLIKACGGERQKLRLRSTQRWWSRVVICTCSKGKAAKFMSQFEFWVFVKRELQDIWP
jgi:hypothetical protein